MPIDNLTLLKHEPPPPCPPRKRPWWVALLVFIVGAALLTSAATYALGDPARSQAVGALLLTVAGVFWLWRLCIGWQEDGFQITRSGNTSHRSQARPCIPPETSHRRLSWQTGK